MPAKPPSMSASSRTYEALRRLRPISAGGVVVICSTPTTSAILADRAAIDCRAPCTAADPVAQAFSTRVARLKRSSGDACKTSEAVKSCAEKPALKWPSTISSTSFAAIPASANASVATRTTRLSTVSPLSLPNGVWAQPTMQAVIIPPEVLQCRTFVAFHWLRNDCDPHCLRIALFVFAFEAGLGLHGYAPKLREYVA